MSNAVAIRAQFNTAAKAPRLTASQRRLLADPFSLGGELVAWEPPGDAEWCRRERPRILVVKGEIERGLMAPTPSHVEWCVRKLFALPSRNATEVEKAFQTDNFMDVCGHFPDDLWTWATTELLKTSTFRPSPAEMVKLVEPKYAERQRMLERVKQLLGGAKPTPALPRTEQPIPTRLGRLQHIRSTYERMGRTADVERIDREIAVEQGVTNEGAKSYETAVIAAPGPFKPADTPTNRRLAELASAKREGRQPAEYRDVPEGAAP